MKGDKRMSEDIKKVPDEVKDEDLEFVAGGAYTYEQWKALTDEQKLAAQARSQAAKGQKKPCELDPGVTPPGF